VKPSAIGGTNFTVKKSVPTVKKTGPTVFFTVEYTVKPA